MTEKLSPINVPEARKLILKSIADYRNQQRLVEILEPFLREAVTKRIDHRISTRLHEKLVAEAPELKVYRVLYSSAKDVMGRPEFKLRISGYDWQQDERSFLVRQKDDGTWDIDDTFIADRSWAMQADFLEHKLHKFAYNATKFNDMLAALKNMAEEAMPPGEHFPVYPLSDFYCYYRLR